MNFKPELAEKVMAGEKTVTRRLANDNPRSPWYINSSSLRVGRDYAVCPGRGKDQIGRVRIVDLELMRLGRLDYAEARREGFRDCNHFEGIWQAINGSYNEQALVWRVEFEVVAVDADEWFGDGPYHPARVAGIA